MSCGGEVIMTRSLHRLAVAFKRRIRHGDEKPMARR